MLSFLLIPPDGIEAGIIPGDPDGPQRDPSKQRPVSANSPKHARGLLSEDSLLPVWSGPRGRTVRLSQIIKQAGNICPDSLREFTIPKPVKNRLF
jgi:hypothetical protein